MMYLHDTRTPLASSIAPSKNKFGLDADVNAEFVFCRVRKLDDREHIMLENFVPAVASCWRLRSRGCNSGSYCS